MKKYIIILIISLFYSLEAESQSQKFKLGFRVGFNYSNITNLTSNYKFGGFGGVFGELVLTKHYALQPELNFSQQGAADAEKKLNNTTQPYYTISYEDINLNYLSIAVVNKFTFADKINLLVGPSIDFLTVSKYGINSDLDLSMIVGFGIKVNNNFSLDARFKKGIVDVVDYVDYQTNNDFLFGDYNTNILFQLGATYTFDLK